MPAAAWLLIALAAGTGAWYAGRPAWEARRSRDARDTNTERYLAWRGRASEARGAPSVPPVAEQRRLWLAAALTVVAVAALIGFFVAS